MNITDDFWKFHHAHPEVYETLVRRARDLSERGYRRLGIGMLWEVMRYTSMIGARPGEEAYRLNNNYRSRYVRIIIDQEPDLRSLFEIRELRSA